MAVKQVNTHSTYIELADKIRTVIVLKTRGIRKLSAGLIKPAGASGRQFVRLSNESPTCLLLEVRGSTAVQEMRVYSQTLPEVKLALARQLRDNKIAIKFG